MKNTLLIFLAAVVLVACDALFGKEVARLPMEQLSNEEVFIKEVTLDLKKGETIALWADNDIEYENDLALVYIVEIFRDGKSMGGLELNALETNPKMMEVRTTVNEKTSWSYSGKMESIEITDDGQYTIKAILKSSDNPTLRIKKADLVIKK
jgi:hypothetical protein